MENNETNINDNEQINSIKLEKSNKKKKRIIIIILVILFVLVALVSTYFILFKDKEKTTNTQTTNKYAEYRLSGNSIEDFDLYFLKLENLETNKVYSPLSIKYALEMLQDGATGDTKNQISNIVGEYKAQKYENNANMSLANALFVKDTYKDNIKENYVNTLSNKYNASVIYDSFQTPNTINSWVRKNTFNLIDNVVENVSDKDFILTNSLAINMDWVKVLQQEAENYKVDYVYEDFFRNILSLREWSYPPLKFNNNSMTASSVQIGADVNKYDIVKELGEEEIINTVTEEYNKWLAGGAEGACDEIETLEEYLDGYIERIDSNYNKISSSTDFSFYVDDNVKVFAKDLKKYNNTTLQYVAIMPKSESLSNYINNIKAKDVDKLIRSLKTIELSNFKEGVITTITGFIPMFDFEYDLDLVKDLKTLGITDVFNDNADLSNITSDKAFINDVSHKSNIKFTNEGIKASAATEVGGSGGGSCGFDYNFKVPVETIDLTFDNPYMFIIRDKDSGEVWFTGTVYEPLKYVSIK